LGGLFVTSTPPEGTSARALLINAAIPGSTVPETGITYTFCFAKAGRVKPKTRKKIRQIKNQFFYYIFS
jgi:hypothetical protein